MARYRSKDRARRYGADHEPYSRAAVFERWGSCCCYCDREATTLDHVAPLGFGGHDEERNVVPACQPCNSSKGRKTLAEWVAKW
ncbi:HNH endonuclease [Streptomyces noursei]|uniref:HNH endonuclease n=1 Tax=Streptomyces noursei TaxID=1971 RepID=UPI00099E908B